MAKSWYQNKLFVIPALLGIASVASVVYATSTPRYSMFELGQAVDTKDLQQVETIIDVKSISKNLVDGVVSEITSETGDKINSNQASGGEVLGLGLLNNMKPSLEILYAKQGQKLLKRFVDRFSGSATQYLVTQKIIWTGDKALLILKVPQGKMNLKVPQLEVELAKVPEVGWKIVGLSEQTIQALYKSQQLSFKASLVPSSSFSNNSTSVSSQTPPVTDTLNKFNFPQASCGDRNIAGNDIWYPVFIDGGDLEDIHNRYCADAISTIRKDTKVQTVQIASFANRDKALEFAKAVGGDVGEPTGADSSGTQAKSSTESVPVNSEPSSSAKTNTTTGRCKFNETTTMNCAVNSTSDGKFSIHWSDGKSDVYQWIGASGNKRNIEDSRGGSWHHSDYRNCRDFSLTNLDNGNVITFTGNNSAC